MAIYQTEVNPDPIGTPKSVNEPTLHIEKLPHAPGIYLYRNRNTDVIYVGKAIDLFRRVRSYFDRIHDDIKTNVLVSQIRTVDYIQTKSEFEALLLEAKFIRKLQPKYNILERDDKSPLYILIDEGSELATIALTRKPKKEERDPKKRYFGPFPQKKITEDILRSIRRAVPYCTQKVRNGRPCFYTHLGLCDPCPSRISGLKDGKEKTGETKRYRKNIKQIIRILSGKSSLVLKDMEKEMNALSEERNFEKASSVKRQFDALLRMIHTTYEPFSFEQSGGSETETEELGDLKNVLSPFYPGITTLKRIECIDVATLFGNQTVASLVTFIDGVQERGSYRKFRMRHVRGISDTASMAETITRRIAHPEWPFPDLLIVDGGKPQVSTAIRTLSDHALTIPVMGLAKQEEQLVIPSNGFLKGITVPLSRPSMNLVRRIRDEAHRFANTYHRNLRRKALIVASKR